MISILIVIAHHHNFTMPKQAEIAEILSGIFPVDAILTAREDLLPYSFDATAVLQQIPAAVVFAKRVEEVSRLLEAANRHGLVIVPRGSGTGLSGGSIPLEGSVVLCLSHMNSILEVDARNLTLLAEAGATTLDIALAAEGAGLFYPPDPGSMKISTIGGNVAENSGGLRGLKYGVTRDYVMGLESRPAFRRGDLYGQQMREGCRGLLAEGSIYRIGRDVRHHHKSLAETHSETSRRQDRSWPHSTRMEDAANTVSAIIAAQIIPCTLEFLDRVTIHCVEDYAKIGLPLELPASC